MTYSATNLPTGASFDVDSHIFEWTPGLGEAGEYNVIFTVTDNGTPPKSASIEVTITVFEKGTLPPDTDGDMSTGNDVVSNTDVDASNGDSMSTDTVENDSSGEDAAGDTGKSIDSGTDASNNGGADSIGVDAKGSSASGGGGCSLTGFDDTAVTQSTMGLLFVLLGFISCLTLLWRTRSRK
jgi:hypothetical protein